MVWPWPPAYLFIWSSPDGRTNLHPRALLDAQDPSFGIENFQEALRLFPPFRDDDGATLGAVEVKCPDCDAVYSSQYVEAHPADIINDS